MIAKLYSAFPGTGKSWYCERTGYKTADSDSSGFDKAEFPENYIEHIKGIRNAYQIILISSHKPVREALIEHKLPFTLVYPDMGLKEEYLERYRSRGNAEAFVKLLDENWTSWITELQNQEGCKHLVLTKGQYLSEAVGKNFDETWVWEKFLSHCAQSADPRAWEQLLEALDSIADTRGIHLKSILERLDRDATIPSRYDHDMLDAAEN